MSRPPRSLRLGLYWAALGGGYSLAGLASGQAVAVRPLAPVLGAALWLVVGAVAGVALGERGGERRWWAATLVWLMAEAVVALVIGFHPTRWVLRPTVAALGVCLVGAGLLAWRSFGALRRGEGSAPGVPALLAAGCGFLVAALFLPVWIHAFAADPRPGWILWGLVDVLWLGAFVAALVVVGTAVARWRSSPVLVVAVLVLASVPVLPRCRLSARRGDAAGPAVLWIVADSLRADRLAGALPSLSRRPATVYDNVVSPFAWTEEAYVAWLGVDAWRPPPQPLSAVRHLTRRLLPRPPSPLVAGASSALFHCYLDLLDDKGVRPWLDGFELVFPGRALGDGEAGAVVARLVVGERLDGVPAPSRWQVRRVAYLDEALVAAAEAHLTRGARGLTIVHLRGGHGPFTGDAEASYRETLVRTDRQIGRLLDAAAAHGVQTLVTTDHSTELGATPRRPGIDRVPLVAVPPLGPERVATPWSTIELAATTARLLTGQAPVCPGDLRCAP